LFVVPADRVISLNAPHRIPPNGLVQPARGLFVTGTSTEVGKTYVTCLLAEWFKLQGCRVGVYKPVASGCERREGELVAEDALALWEAAGRPGTLGEVCPQAFAAPLAPPLAAHIERRTVDRRLLRTGLAAWAPRCDWVLVEGAGGLLSPVSDSDLVADLAADFGYPLIVVAPNSLGVINQTLLTVLAARRHEPPLAVAGVILNDATSPDQSQDISRQFNLDELVRRCPVPILAHVPHRGVVEAVSAIDWRTWS
jgi:dethiobiotin synthetase